MSNWKLKSADIPVPELSEFDPYRNAMMGKGYAKSRYLLAESIAISALDMLEERNNSEIALLNLIRDKYPTVWHEIEADYQSNAETYEFLNQHR